MKKIIRLTESELVSLVKRTIMEDSNNNNKKVFNENRFLEYRTKGKYFYCEKSFSPLQTNEMAFCKAAENVIRQSNKDKSSGKGNKGFYAAFEELITAYFEEEKEDLFKLEVEKLTRDSEIVKKGFNELDEVGDYLRPNCRKVVDRIKIEKDRFFNKFKIYFKSKNDQGQTEYSPINRLNTNYSALAVLITKYYSQKGAFDGIRRLNAEQWDYVAKDWLVTLFRPSKEFLDLRPIEDKKSNPIRPGWEELIDVFFRYNVVLNTNEIRDLVTDILMDTRARGFETENNFERFLIKEKQENRIQDYKRYAYDFGFVDMLLGVDFLVKVNNIWKPVQVKTTATEDTYKIQNLVCKSYNIVEPTEGGWKNWS